MENSVKIKLLPNGLINTYNVISIITVKISGTFSYYIITLYHSYNDDAGHNIILLSVEVFLNFNGR